MKIDDKQKPKLIILCALIVFLIAYGAYKIMGTKTQAAPIVEKPAVTETAPVDDGTNPSGIMLSGQTLAAALSTQKVRDPFAPQVAPKQVRDNSAPVSRVNMTPMVNRVSKLPFMVPFPGPGEASVSTVTAAPVNNPAAELKVVGVIDGEKKLAIIRGSQNERYFVHEGDSVDGKYRIETISRMGVRVRSGDSVFFLRLGGQ
jgi:hypothetical protein